MTWKYLFKKNINSDSNMMDAWVCASLCPSMINGGVDTRVKPKYDKQGNGFLRNSSRITEEGKPSSLLSSFSGLKNDSPLLFLPLYHQSSSFAEEENLPSLSSSDLNQENTSNLSSSKWADNLP